MNPNSAGVLRLTNDLNQSSSAFLFNSVSLSNLASFSAAFEFQITDPQGISDVDGQGADGIAFLVQSNSNSVGGLGGRIGYGDIDNSLAIEFDTWGNNWWDYNDGNHVGINLNGIMVSIDKIAINERLNNAAVWSAWIDYNGIQDLLEVRLSQGTSRPINPILSAFAIDLVSILGTTDAYIGFTSGTGSAGGDHDILSFVFDDDYNPITTISVPEPNGLWLLLSTCCLILMRYRKFVA